MPLPHVKIDVVGEDGRPVPVGSTGSLLVGGGALAGGYLGVGGDNVDDRLIERSSTGERVCRTGDKARVIARACGDGSISASSTNSRSSSTDTVSLFALIGREDAVVKVRGNLVAIAAVEAAFMQCYAAKAKACVAVTIPGFAAGSTDEIGTRTASRDDASSCTEIGMGIVWNDEGCGDQSHDHQEAIRAEAGAASATSARALERPTAADVRSALAGLLPAAAVPLHLVELKTLPVDALAGKCDRRAVQQIIAATVFQHSHELLNTQALGPVTKAELPATDAVDDCTRMVQRLMGQVLQLPSDSLIQPEDDFFSVGGHSVAAVRLCKLLGCRIADLIAHSTPGRLARCLQMGDGVDAGRLPSVNLHRQVRLAEQLAQEEAALLPRSPQKLVRSSSAAHKVILLTGATGYIGNRLLRDFLLSNDISQNMEIVCLVRSVDDHVALERMQSSLQNTPLDADGGSCVVDDVRISGHVGVAISAIAGDIAAPLLGLSPDAWLALADSVCAVVHTAAIVDRFAPLSALSSANVHATARLTHLAASAGAAMHFISSRYAQVSRLGLDT
jgi:hypothetical protein